LEAVLQQANGAYSEIWCCGDLVGYGADPDWVTQWAQESVRAIVRGNHDKACAGLEDLEWFNPAARASALWTQATLSSDSTEYLTELPQGPLSIESAYLVHGSPVDEDEYLIQVRDAAEVAPYLDGPVTFFGHTHVQGGFLIRRKSVVRIAAVARDESTAVLQMDADSFYLVNPGSVGQPRDGDWRAAYAIYDTDHRTVEYFRTEYDVAGAQRKIRAAGLPAALADRLAVGV
jgi:diadenosine tetraphosphatase ApaH/serine/threonine PP2A family protein phosphatase